MATHHEYDDRFWRFVENFKVAPANASYKRLDSALWQVSIRGKTAVIEYKIHVPQNFSRFAHRPFLSSMGGLVGDIHSFMYLPAYTSIASTITFKLPEGWKIATGLERTKADNIFTAPGAATLLDCPVLIGRLRQWQFMVKGVPHTVAYLPVENASAFDTSLFVSSIQKIVEHSANVFRSFPYRHYTFLMEDGVEGALEHRNSVTLGAPSAMLASDMKQFYEEWSHEFFHSWNLMCIKPAEYTKLNYGPQQVSSGLWFSEGFTMFYADLLLRRAGLPFGDISDSTRTGHLQSLIRRYYSDTGNTIVSPMKVSETSNASPGLLGDYSASVHLQGELIAAIVDIMIRKSTGNKKSMDDLMRFLYEHFNKKGFYSTDVEKAAVAVCGCANKIHTFFRKYVYGNSALDFNGFLNSIGLQIQISYSMATDNEGKALPDLRVYAWQSAGDHFYHIGITNPSNCWVRAGIHTGDVILSINNKAILTRQDFTAAIRSLHVNDTVWIQTKKDNSIKTIPVIIGNYTVPTVSIISINKSSEQQQFFEKWNRADAN